jgi:hypothetical protein
MSSSITMLANAVAIVDPQVIVEPVSPELRNAVSMPVVGDEYDTSRDSVHDPGSVIAGVKVPPITTPIHRFAVNAAWVPENVVPTLRSNTGAGVVPAPPVD